MAVLTNTKAWYEGDDVTDTVGGYDLTTNTSTFTAGKIGNAFTFDGTQDGRIATTIGHDLNCGDRNWMLSVWMYFESANMGVQKTAVGLSNQDWVVYKLSNDRLRFQIGHSGGASNVTPSFVVTVSTWVHIICKFNTTSRDMTMLIDGGADSGTTNISTNVPLDRATNFNIGAHSAGSRMTGKVDEVVIGNTTLWDSSDDDALWNGGDGLSYAAAVGGGSSILSNAYRYPLGLSL